jgi:hypothetical protein
VTQRQNATSSKDTKTEPPDAERRRLRAAIWAVIDVFEGAAANFESKGKGGQRVTYTGDFANMAPSAATQMRRWAQDLRCALKNEWPMLREEYVKAFGTTDSESLDYMFRERKP